MRAGNYTETEGNKLGVETTWGAQIADYDAIHPEIMLLTSVTCNRCSTKQAALNDTWLSNHTGCCRQ